MTTAAIGFIARGRIAWIIGMAFGVILALIGGFTGPNVPLIVAGGVLFLFGLVMLIISLATGGRSD
jgi:hypothetical protein